ncbi:MAG: formate--tetrahydrofolate ligase, partial [Rhodothermales bacterium]
LMHERNYPGEKWKKRTASDERPDGLPRLDINPYTITWNRVVDANDRALRHLNLGLGTKADGFPREASYDITVASEVMAIFGAGFRVFLHGCASRPAPTYWSHRRRV